MFRSVARACERLLAVIAIFAAQIIDPIRVIVLAICYFTCRTMFDRQTSWAVYGILAAIVAFAVPFLVLGHRGDFAVISSVIGLAANALITAVFFGISKLLDR